MNDISGDDERFCITVDERDHVTELMKLRISQNFDEQEKPEEKLLFVLNEILAELKYVADMVNEIRRN